MNVSVLIVGDDKFSIRLCQQVRGLSAMTQWQVDSAYEATRLLESENPEVLLLQATQQDNWELCRTLRQQRHSTGSYCILLDERPCPEAHTATEALLRQTGLMTTALEIGADTYLWVPDILAERPQLSADYLSRLIQAHMRTAMRRIQAYKELSQTNDLLSAIALVDTLTQLGNRRAFDWELPRQIEVSREQQHPLSLLVLDIDYFKRVNDEHGHLVGDQVLRMFSERLRHHMRFYETPFRYGGEEFVVLLPNTSPPEAEKTGERLRQLINDTPFVIDADLLLSLTVSIGVATLAPSDDIKGIELIARADSNLLRAKSTGRNRVIF
ncbi:MAG: diguanylate cyclase [Leptolyngbya sp. SIO1E4]|nr:diguanylate cyclase [Leptolyngbya sp. SIO1E4]